MEAIFELAYKLRNEEIAQKEPKHVHSPIIHGQTVICIDCDEILEYIHFIPSYCHLQHTSPKSKPYKRRIYTERMMRKYHIDRSILEAVLNAHIAFCRHIKGPNRKYFLSNRYVFYRVNDILGKPQTSRLPKTGAIVKELDKHWAVICRIMNWPFLVD